MRQAGRTLIELLVALALGMLILLGVGSLYMSANQSSRAGVALSRTVESGSAVANMIGLAIRRAAYSEIVGTEVAPSAALSRKLNLRFDYVPVRGCSAGRYTDFMNAQSPCSAPSASVQGDELVLAFQSDSATRPVSTRSGCGGLVPDATPASIILNRYWLEGTTLFCRSWFLNSSTAGPPVALASNVIGFRTYFGFDTGAYTGASAIDAPPVAQNVHSASEINAMAPLGGVSPWNFVVSVHLCIRVFSDEGGVVVAPSDATYPSCPDSAAAVVAAGGNVGDLPANVPPGAIVRAFQQSYAIRTAAAGLP